MTAPPAPPADPPAATSPLGGLILAGGRSSRFGADKMLAPLAGKPLVAHALERLRPRVAALAISANGDTARFAGFAAPVLPDPVEGFQGPLAGVLAGLLWAEREGLWGIVTVAGDTPVFPEDLVLALRVAAYGAQTGCAIAFSPDGRGGIDPHPTFGLWSAALAGPLAEALARGERRVRAFAEAHRAARAIFEGRGPACFHNVNTPADLARAESAR